MFLKILQDYQENTCYIVPFLKLQARAGNFIKKEALAQMFSREFCKTFKNIFFIEHLQVTASHSFKMIAFPLIMKLIDLRTGQYK